VVYKDFCENDVNKKRKKRTNNRERERMRGRERKRKRKRECMLCVYCKGNDDGVGSPAIVSLPPSGGKAQIHAGCLTA
jgi:hypothetical protein